MSNDISDRAEVVIIGDGAKTATLEVTTSNTVVNVPAAMRGKFVMMYISAGTAYLSVGSPATGANGFRIPAGPPMRVYIPTFKDNQDPYPINVLGSAEATLKVIEASS